MTAASLLRMVFCTLVWLLAHLVPPSWRYQYFMGIRWLVRLI